MTIKLKNLLIIYVFGVVSLFLAQLAMGANVWVASCLTIVSLMGAYPLSKRVFTVGDFVFFLLVLYSATLTLVLKTMLQQNVETNLMVPMESASALLIGMTSAFAGYVLSTFVPFERLPAWLAQPINQPALLNRLALPVFVAGLVTQILHNLLVGRVNPLTQVADQGFGGFGAFYALLLLGFAMQAALTFTEDSSKHRRRLIIMLLCILALTLMANVRKTLVDAAMLLALLVYAYEVRIRFKTVLLAAVTVFFVSSVLSPVIHIARSQVYGLNPIERLWAAAEVFIEAGGNVDELWETYDQEARQVSFYFRESASYYYPNTANIDRFSMIMPIDQVARYLDARGVLPFDPVRDVLADVLPSGFIEKSSARNPDYIAWHYGFRVHGNIARPVVGLVASTLANFGWIGLWFVPAIVMGAGLAVLTRIGGAIQGNLWAAFLATAVSFLAEKEVGTFLSYFMRELPLTLFTVYLILQLSQLRIRRNRHQKIARGHRSPGSALGQGAVTSNR